jgi:hypothetical protein
MSHDAFHIVVMYAFMVSALDQKSVNVNLDMGDLPVTFLVLLENMDHSAKEIASAKTKRYVMQSLEHVLVNQAGKVLTAAYPVIKISMAIIVNRNVVVKMVPLVIPYLVLVNVHLDIEGHCVLNHVQKGLMVTHVLANVSVRMVELVIA